MATLFSSSSVFGSLIFPKAVAVILSILLLGAAPRCDAYYSTVCNTCGFNFPSGSIQSEYIYGSFFEAKSACVDDCNGCGFHLNPGYDECLQNKFRQPCKKILRKREKELEQKGALCKFGEDAIGQCIQYMGVRSETCEIMCTASQSTDGGPYFAYLSYWNIDTDVWGKCQNWKCENCEYNRLACFNNKDCLCPLGVLTCFEPNKVIPVDEVYDQAMRDSLSLECRTGAEADCMQEWAVCHHWCNLSEIPKCDDERERCINSCLCDLYGWFWCPAPNNNNVGPYRHLAFDPDVAAENQRIPWDTRCEDKCHAAWDSCVAAQADDNSCPVELTVETGDVDVKNGISTMCPKIAFYPNGKGSRVVETFCDLPGYGQSKTFAFELPGYFDCRLSKFVLLASSRDGWFIKSASIRVGKSGSSHKQVLNLTNPITGRKGIWLDGESYDLMDEFGYSGYPYNKKWIFRLKNPSSFPKLKQFEVVFLAGSEKRGRRSNMSPQLVIFPHGTGGAVTVRFQLRRPESEVVSVVVSGTEEFIKAGGIEKLQLKATSTDGWFIERMYATFNGALSEIDLLNIDTGARGIWLDGKPFNPAETYGNSPTFSCDVSDYFTFTLKGYKVGLH